MVLLPVYGARETQEQFPDVGSHMIADLLRGRADGPEVHEVDGLAAAAPALAGIVRGPEDLVVTVGAGDITTVGPQLLELLRDRDAQATQDAEDAQTGDQA